MLALNSVSIEHDLGTCDLTPSECWGYRYASQYLVYAVLTIEPRSVCQADTAEPPERTTIVSTSEMKLHQLIKRIRVLLPFKKHNDKLVNVHL